MTERKKYICVIGLGQFGSELAVALAPHAEVLAIDTDPAKVNALADRVQRALILDARDHHSLASVVTADFDEAIISLGENLEASVLATLHCQRIGVRHIRAKAISHDHADILHAVGAADVIFPERESARRVARQIQNPNLLDFLPMETEYRVMEVAPPQAFIGKSLKELRLRNAFDVLVVAIKELVPERFDFLPPPDFVIKPSDILVLVGKPDDIVRISDEHLS